MKRCFLLTVLFLFGAIVPAHAQRPETASAEMITDVLKALNCRFTVDDWKYSVTMKNRQFMLYRLDNGARLLVKASIKGNASLRTINRYNEKTAVTTRAVQYEKFGLTLEAGVDCQLGISEAGLRRFVLRFQDDITDFEKFVAAAANDKDAPEAPAVVKKGEKQPVPVQFASKTDDREFTITYPTGEKNWETAWKIIWDMETGKQANEQGFRSTVRGKDGQLQPGFGFGRQNAVVLFKIKRAYFKPSPQAEWLQVLDDAHPQEFYVPYYFRGTRFYDLKGVGHYVTLNPKEGGAISQVLGKNKLVMAELRDTGVAYKHGNITRRGEELTLWANFAAANYTYMVEYGFRDDGVIVFRHAPTGYNYFNHFDASHMHGSYWRIGVKLGPDGNNDINQVYSVHLPTDPNEQAKDADKGGKLNIKEITTESFLDWDPQEFTRLRVTNPNVSLVSENAEKRLPIAYDLVTVPQGLARHKRFADETFTHHDFWITRADCSEKMYINLGNHFFPKEKEKREPAPLDRGNVVIFHSSSALHVPRSEDGIIGGNNLNNGQAMIFWTTFELRPRNLFDRTPIYRNLDGPMKNKKKPAEAPDFR
jgi:hypothetical protein